MENIKYHRISFDVTFRCTLKCKLCCAYAPYRTDPPEHYTYQELTEGISHFFELVDTVDIFTFGGGEPFLHQQLAEIFAFMAQYRDRIGRLEVITNGTVVPGTQLLSAIKNVNGRVLLDDYGPGISTAAPAIAAALQENGVCYEHRYNSDTEKGAYCSGWVDLFPAGEASSYQVAKEHFDRCLQAHELRCHPVIGGKVYICPLYEFCVHLGLVEDNPKFYIDLFDTSQSLAERRKKASDFLKIDFLPSCAFCKGFFPDSERFVPAQQLTTEELKSIRALLSKNESAPENTNNNGELKC